MTGTATVTVAKYPGNPGTAFSGDIGKHIDVYIGDISQVDEIEIRLYYTDADISGKVESSLQLRWWNGTTWQVCSDTGVNTDAIDGYSGYIWARIGTNTTPSLDDLTGTPFGASATTQSPGGGGGGGGVPEGVTFVFDFISPQGKFV